MVDSLGQWKSIFWNFSNTWLSPDGTEFVCIFIGTRDMDSSNMIKGHFVINEGLQADLNVDGMADALDRTDEVGDRVRDAAMITAVNESASRPRTDINRDTMVHLLDFVPLA